MRGWPFFFFCCSVVNWLKQMVPQPVTPGSIPTEPSSKSSRSSLDKSTNKYTKLSSSTPVGRGTNIHWQRQSQLMNTNLKPARLKIPITLRTHFDLLGWILVLHAELHVCLSSFVSTTWISQWHLTGYWQQGLRVRFQSLSFSSRASHLLSLRRAERQKTL